MESNRIDLKPNNESPSEGHDLEGKRKKEEKDLARIMAAFERGKDRQAKAAESNGTSNFVTELLRNASEKSS